MTAVETHHLTFRMRLTRLMRAGCPLVLTVVFGTTSVLAQPAPTGQTADDLAGGKRLFEGYCARCHGMKGAGGRGANLRRPILRRAGDDQEVFSVIQGGIPGTEMPGNWFLTDREIWQVVGYVRSLGRTVVEPASGDPKKGRLTFAKGECAKCHVVRGKGASVGPDLTDVGARRGRDFLRKAVAEPGKEKALDARGYTAFLLVVVITNEGRVVTGTRINEDTFTLQLRDETGRLHSFRKRDLQALRKIDGSLMPGYEQLLSRTEIDDLIFYLAQLQGQP